MPVEKPDVIDIVAHNAERNEVTLVMMETRNWNRVPEAVPQLEVKLRAYADFIMSGALARQNPKFSNCPVRIELYHLSPIPAQVAEVLREWGSRLSGIPVPVCSRRMSWNLIVTFIRILAAKFTSSQRQCVCWNREPEFTDPWLSPAQFAEEFASALRSKRADLLVQIVQGLEIKVVKANGEQFQGFLDNAYSQYRISPENKTEILQKYAASLLETAQTQAQPKQNDRIVPIIKDKGWIAEVREGLKARGSENTLEHIHEPYNTELDIVYAVETPNNIRYLTATDLKELQVEPSQLHVLACANLERLLPVPDIHMEDGLYRIRAGGDYDASLLLLESLWTAGKIPVPGEIVAAIPARDYLVVTGSENPIGMKKIRTLAQAVAAQAPYRLTPRLFVYRQAQFVPYEP